MDRFLKTSYLRQLEYQVAKGEISYSKMVENINLAANKFYVSKIYNITKKEETTIIMAPEKEWICETPITACCKRGPITDENYCAHCGKKIKREIL